MVWNGETEMRKKRGGAGLKGYLSGIEVAVSSRRRGLDAKGKRNLLLNMDAAAIRGVLDKVLSAGAWKRGVPVNNELLAAKCAEAAAGERCFTGELNKPHALRGACGFLTGAVSKSHNVVHLLMHKWVPGQSRQTYRASVVGKRIKSRAPEGIPKGCEQAIKKFLSDPAIEKFLSDQSVTSSWCG
jgi:hypothetical protein